MGILKRTFYNYFLKKIKRKENEVHYLFGKYFPWYQYIKFIFILNQKVRYDHPLNWFENESFSSLFYKNMNNNKNYLITYEHNELKYFIF